MQKFVILDKNFVQSENCSTPRLKALALCECQLVLTDTLVYEICSDNRLNDLWLVMQKKLFPFAELFQVWKHTSELVRIEVATKKPVIDPIDEIATSRLREWFRSGKGYVPDNMANIVGDARKQREVDTMSRVAPMARAIGKMIASDGKGGAIASKEVLAALVKDGLNNGLLQWTIKACYGNPASKESYIESAETKVDSTWFSYHSARATLALVGIYLQKYGLNDSPGEKFSNTILDLDYLALLHYADALASDETKDMAVLLHWLYGSTKNQIKSNDLMNAIPTDEAIRTEAFHRWELRGRAHGSHVEDWLVTERNLYARSWDRLVG